MRGPIAGDPQDLQRAAGLLARAADDLAAQERTLRRGTSVATAGWLGAAANAFSAATGEHAARLMHARRTLGSLGTAVHDYSVMLDSLQSRASTLAARRGALTEDLRAARRQQGAATAGGGSESLTDQIVLQIRRVDDEVEDLQRQAAAAGRRLTATLDGSAPTHSPHHGQPRPPALSASVLRDLTATGTTSALAGVWSDCIPTAPAPVWTGRMHCGPVRQVLTDPGPFMRTGPVGQDVGPPPGHRMRTGPVRPVPADPMRHVTTGPIGPMS